MQTRRFLEGRERLLIHPGADELARRQTCETSAPSSLDQTLPARRQRADHLRQAHDVSAEWQVRVLAAFQKHVDNGVSKTVNLPASSTHRDVSRALSVARDLGCKGVTVFRDGSKKAQVLQRDSSHFMQEVGVQGTCAVCG